MSGFDVVGFVGSQVGLFNQALSDQSITWQKEQQFAIQAFQKNDYLAKVAMANQSSAQNAIINVAAIGITLNPAAKLAYLVPRDGGVHLDISYMGLLHLAQVSGAIQWGQCKLVYASDTYESNGLDSAPTHKYNAFGERGAVVGGYCTVKTAQGDYLTEEMSLAEIKQVEASSKAKNGPWQKWWDEMARKTIVKRASKYWPRVERLDMAVHHLNTEGGEGFVDELERKEEIILNPVEAIKAAITSKGRTEEQFFAWFSSAKKLPEPIHAFEAMNDDELQWAARKMEATK
jgi:recombination protein RecT